MAGPLALGYHLRVGSRLRGIMRRLRLVVSLGLGRVVRRRLVPLRLILVGWMGNGVLRSLVKVWVVLLRLSRHCVLKIGALSLRLRSVIWGHMLLARRWVIHHRLVVERSPREGLLLM